MSWTTRILITITLLFICALALGAQQVVLKMGIITPIPVAPGQKVNVPVVMDMGAARGMNVAALQMQVNFSVQRIVLDSITTGMWPSLQNRAVPGQVRWAAMGEPVTFTRTVATMHFTAKQVLGITNVTITAIGAGNEAGGNISHQVMPRLLAICVTPTGRCQ